MKDQTSNPKGKNGKPITLAPMTFEEAIKKMLSTQPPKTEEKAAKPQKKTAKSKPKPSEG
jgi:hypothetical protein